MTIFIICRTFSDLRTMNTQGYLQMDISVHICIKTPNDTMPCITQSCRESKGQACSYWQAVNQGQRQGRKVCILPQQGRQAHPPALKILQLVIETWLICGFHHIGGFLSIIGQFSEVRVNAFKSLRVLQMKHNQYVSQFGPCSCLKAETSPTPRRDLGEKEQHLDILIFESFVFCLCR